MLALAGREQEIYPRSGFHYAGCTLLMMKEEIEERLKQVSGWKLIGDAIEKDFEFSDFRQTIEFVNRVADVAARALTFQEKRMMFEKNGG